MAEHDASQLIHLVVEGEEHESVEWRGPLEDEILTADGRTWRRAGRNDTQAASVHYELVSESRFHRAMTCQVRRDVPVGGTRGVWRLALASIDGDLIHVEALHVDGAFDDDVLNVVGPWLNRHQLGYKGSAAWRESRVDGAEQWQADVYPYAGP
jgi:hypothetical protein